MKNQNGKKIPLTRKMIKRIKKEKEQLIKDNKIVTK